MDIIKKLEALQKTKTNKAILKILKILAMFTFRASVYLLLVWIFLNIYENIGFEKTLIIVLIGVIHYGIFRK